MEKKRTRFPFEALEYKAAQEWLNGLGAQGWRLVESRRGRLGFVRDGGGAVSYAVDLDRNLPPMEEAEYFSLCADAGWKRAAATPAGLLIFVSEPGARPTPLQTEPELERQALRGYLVKRWAAALLRVAWSLLLLVLNSGVLGRMARLDGFWLLAAGVILTWALTGWRIAVETVFYLRCRRAVRAGWEIPPERLLLRRLDAALQILCLLLVLVGVPLLLWQVFAGGISG